MKKTFKFIPISLLSLFIISCSTSKSDRFIATSGDGERVEAYMSPHQGPEAFERMYDLIRDAKKDVNVTVYSWSDHGFTKALHAALDKSKPPIVRVVMKKGVFKKHAKDIIELEKKGAMFKIAKVALHEKFVLADDYYLVNSSANMSGGARTRYSENFVFFNAKNSANNSDVRSILKDFRQEFAIIWNSAHDYKTESEKYPSDVLNHKTKRANKVTALKNLSLYSTSMNYKIGRPSKRDFDKGSVIGLKRLPNKKEQIWTVKSQIIKSIEEAQKNIYLNINHFNLREISDALIEAVKRGVDVKLVVDNQEFKRYPNNKEMTPQFVKDWHILKGKNVLPPVRVKFYSFSPHFSSWSLDHHKYMIIDYDKAPGHGTKLLTGSYNYSKTAEHSKFDNQILFQGSEYHHIYKAFHDEFESLWLMRRDDKDQPIKEFTDVFVKVKKGKLALHSSRPIGLTWKEILDLKKVLNESFPTASRQFYKMKHCNYYDVEKKVYYKRNGKTICEPKTRGH